ncbi:hypothetical protein GCM10011416_14580 [Polaribacter pacificus]|uniref:Uncharacterized protein n=1 Tax=Polaribacter pacificus TaxID=1775173 RepID=A0A917MD50_9FLAO|nr:hypothetical protein [Polaribacter pacificus]GGG97623.1 hypothetical protein GCM10011416_14580 [Polaribacter pacificus]
MMKNNSKRKTLILFSIGLFVIASSQLLSQFTEITDMMKGSLMGFAIGLLLTSLMFGNFKTA